MIIDLEPDPRISTLRPGWLADDEQWRDQLQAMDREDARWVERQWDLAGGAQPAVDTSWLHMEPVGTSPWLALIVVVPAVVFVALAVWEVRTT